MLTWDSESTKRALFDSVAAILMTSSSPFVREGEKEKKGRRKTFPRRPLRRLTSCQESRGMLTSSCWLLTDDFGWSRGDIDGSVSRGLIGQRECGVLSMSGLGLKLSMRQKDLSDGVREGRAETLSWLRDGKLSLHKWIQYYYLYSFVSSLNEATQ